MPPLSLEDTSRFGNDGVFIGATAWVQLLSGLWVMSFDGATSRVNCGTDVSLRPTGDKLTLEMWANISQSALQGFMDSTQAGEGYRLAVDASRRILFDAFIGGIQRSMTAALSLLTVGRWAHCVGVYDGTNMIIYQDGTFRNSQAQAGNLDASSVSLDLGSIWGGAIWFLLGYLAFVKVYNYALSAADIWAHFQAERRWFGV